MPTIEASITVPSAPARTFAEVDFFGNAAWIPGTKSVEHTGSGVGALRTVTTVDGARIVERLESHDAQAGVYSYAIVEAPMPISSYLATVQVTPVADGCQVRWSAEFEADDAVVEGIRAALTGLFEAALFGLRSRLN